MLHALSNSSPLVNIAAGLNSSHVRESIPEGDAGTAATIARMQRLVSKGKRDKEVRVVVGKIIHGEYDGIPACGNKDHLCYIRNLFEFCRKKIYYAFDPNLVEYVENPAYILRSRIADCDSIVGLFCAMAEGIGYPCEFVTIKADPERPSEFSHVFCRVQCPNIGWISIDPTMPRKPFGWQAPSYYSAKYWWASTDDQGAPDETPSVSLDSLPSNTAGAANMLTGLKDNGWCGGPFMSGLACAGKADCGCGCKDKSMSGLYGLADTTTEVSIMGILDGTALNQIRKLYSDYQNNAAALDRTKAALDKMPMSGDKVKAILAQGKGEDALRQQFVVYRQLRDDYNSFITQAKPYFFGLWNPGMAGMKGMSGLGFVPQAVIAIAAIAALSLLADKIAMAISAGQGKNIETKGYIEQATDLINAGAGLIGNVTKAAVVGGLAFLAYTFLKHKGLVGSK